MYKNYANKLKREIWIIPLKDLKVRYISWQVNDMWGSYESMTFEVNCIYLTFGSFNGIDPIIPTKKHLHVWFRSKIDRTSHVRLTYQPTVHFS
jgi:hypothetical protein